MSVRDTNHYWDVLIFSVEGSLFKLPKYQFVKNSEVFETMCSLPQGAQSNEGSCDDNPIKLEGVKCEDFKRFAEMLYPLEIPQQLAQKTKEEWISILKLSTMWGFLRIRALAIDSLTIVDPIERIQLARDYSVSAWLRSGYIDIASRESTVSDKEVAILGYASAIRMFRARERILKQRLMHVPRPARSPWDFLPGNDGGYLVRSEVEQEFREEFEEADAANELYEEEGEKLPVALEYAMPPLRAAS